jgi:hypothetical protein
VLRHLSVRDIAVEGVGIDAIVSRLYRGNGSNGKIRKDPALVEDGVNPL